jgi:CheY-like chemotaxis protein
MGRVVWVEDDPTIRKLVEAALRSAGHDLQFATNGRDGLALVRRVHPDVVFTDVSMPVMDWLAFADAVRADPTLADVRIVFVTASMQREQIERYTARGATFIAKPFSTAELRAHVERLVTG